MYHQEEATPSSPSKPRVKIQAFRATRLTSKGVEGRETERALYRSIREQAGWHVPDSQIHYRRHEAAGLDVHEATVTLYVPVSNN